MVVVAIALLAARLGRRGGGRASGVDLKVVERIGLTREAAAVVLEAGGRRLLLGVSAHGVTMLADLGQDETIPIVARPALEPAPTAVVATLPRQLGPWHSSPASQGWADSAEGRAELGPGRRYDRDVDRHRDDDPVRGRRDDLVQDRYDGLVQD